MKVVENDRGPPIFRIGSEISLPRRLGSRSRPGFIQIQLYIQSYIIRMYIQSYIIHAYIIRMYAQAYIIQSYIIQSYIIRLYNIQTKKTHRNGALYRVGLQGFVWCCVKQHHTKRTPSCETVRYWVLLVCRNNRAYTTQQRAKNINGVVTKLVHGSTC